MIRRLAIITVAFATLCTVAACSTTPSATVQSISVSPIIVSAGGTQQLVVNATMSDGTTESVSGSATYVSADTGVAIVSTTGLVTGVATGSTTVTVTFSSQTATAGVTVIS